MTLPLLCCLAFAQELPGALSAEDGLKALHARPGFRVERMLAEPATMDPVHFAWGADGVLWIVEMADYPLGSDGKGKPGGRVRRVELDAAGGYANGRNTVFLDGLKYPTSVQPHRAGVLVAMAGAVLYAEDADGDGVADRRETLLDQLHIGNPQHLVNGFDWGLDGWLCLNNIEGRVRVAKTGKAYDIRRQDARWRPDTGAFEPAAGPTQFGRTRDDWDRWIGGDNSHPFRQFALPDHYLRRNPSAPYPSGTVELGDVPGPAPVFPRSATVARFNDLWAANRFTSANRPCVYRDELFGPAFAGSAFVSEPVHNLVSRLELRLEGLHYRGRRAADERQSEFLAAADGWFRPATLATGPDGALWVADMHRQVIEHPEWIPKAVQAKVDLRAGAERGRLYRVLPTNAAARPIPNLARLNNVELAAALDSPSGWQRDAAARLLRERNAQDAAPTLAALARSAPRPATRGQALCVLALLDALEPALLAAALADPHAEVRRQAVRLCEGRWAHVETFGAALLALEHDPDLGVRQQLAFTLGDWREPRAAEALGRLARRDGGDPRFAAAVHSSLRPETLETVCRALGPARGDEAALVGPLWRLAEEWRQPAAAKVLAGRLVPPPGTKIEPWRWQALAGLLDALEARGGKLDEPRRFALVFDAARRAARKPDADLETRISALPLLGRVAGGAEPGDGAVLTELLEPRVPAALQAAAALALARRGDYQSLAAAWRRLSPGVRQAAAPRFLERPAGRAALRAALENGQIQPIDLDAATRARLLAEAAGEGQAAVAKLLGGADSSRAAAVERYRPVLAQTGDPGRGAELFKKHCAACHQLAGVGNAVGPDLAATRGKTKEFWLESVLDPNRAVEARFIGYVAELADGRRLAGVVVEESATGVVLAGADGKPVAVLRKDLDRLASTGKSAMPEGLEKDLPPAAMADLLAHLAAAAPPEVPKRVAGNQPAPVRPEPDGALVCKPSAAELFGPSIVWEARHGNLGYWQSGRDRAEWSLAAPKAGRYAVNIEFACPPEFAGQPYEVVVAGRTLASAAAATRGWDDYRAVWLGTVPLPAGPVRLAVRPRGPLKGPLFDLKRVTLHPAH